MRDYYTAAIPELHTILGVPLLPLSLGHLLHLNRYECDPVDDEAKLITALLICSRRVEEIQPALDSPLFQLKTNLWLWRVSRKSWPAFWRRGPINWHDKLARWDAYMKASTKTPPTCSKRKDSNFSTRTPFLQHLKVFLMAKLHCTRTEALNYPFAEAAFDYFTHYEQEGAVEIVDESHVIAMKKCADDNHERWLAIAAEMRSKRQ